MKFLLSLIICMYAASVGAQKRIISPEETEYLKMIEKQKINIEAQIQKTPAEVKNNVEVGVPTPSEGSAQVAPKKMPPLYQQKNNSGSRKIYTPAPVVNQAEQNGYLLERDSTKIVNVKMSQQDVLNVRVCISAGVSVSLDEESMAGEKFQRVIIDDNDYFEAKEFDNKRGVYFRLKQAIQPGFFWESALRLVSETNDKSFLVNLLGVPCPDGPNPYPKVYYIGAYAEQVNGLNTSILTPEDLIIQASEGLPRISKNVIRVYDMVTSAGSPYAVFGVEVQYHKSYPERDKLLMKVLDNHQTTIKESKMKPLKLQSEKATEFYGVPTLRFNLVVNIDKDYIINRRYIYLMVLSQATGHYQYQQIDLLPFLSSLKKRGYKL